MNARNVEPPIARYTTSCLRRIRASPIPEARPAQGGRGPRHAGPAPTRRSGGAADDTQAAQEARPTPEPKVRGLVWEFFCQVFVWFVAVPCLERKGRSSSRRLRSG